MYQPIRQVSVLSKFDFDFFVLLKLRQMKKNICSIRTRIKNCTNTENLVQSSDNDVNLKKI